MFNFIFDGEYIIIVMIYSSLCGIIDKIKKGLAGTENVDAW